MIEEFVKISWVLYTTQEAYYVVVIEMMQKYSYEDSF